MPLTLSLGNQYIAQVTIGSQLFNLIVDTGSSAAWGASPGYQCINSSALPKQQAIDQSNCGFGNLYKPNETFQAIPDKQQTNIYGTGSTFTSGPLGRDTFSLDGTSFPSQEFTAATLTSFAQPDNFTTGLFSLAYPAGTSVYNGSKGSLDDLQTPPRMHHSSRRSPTVT